MRLLHGVRAYDDYFRLKKDTMDNLVFTSYHRYTVAVRMIVYGVFGDLVHEYMCINECTCID
jgi:hypothetical protein